MGLGVSKGEIGGGAENPSRVGNLHSSVDEEGICHVDISDTEIGELVVDVTSKHIENVGVLCEDSGGVGIGVPGGRV